MRKTKHGMQITLSSSSRPPHGRRLPNRSTHRIPRKKILHVHTTNGQKQEKEREGKRLRAGIMCVGGKSAGPASPPLLLLPPPSPQINQPILDQPNRFGRKNTPPRLASSDLSES